MTLFVSWDNMIKRSPHMLGIYAIAIFGMLVGCAGTRGSRPVASSQPKHACATQPAEWGESCGGLQARLSVDRPDLRADEPFTLRVELRNTTDHDMRLPDPTPFPMIAADDSEPYREGSAKYFNSRLTAEPLDFRIRIDWINRSYAPPPPRVWILQPGGVLVLDVKATDDSGMNTADEPNGAQGPQRMGSAMDAPMHFTARFCYLDNDGSYRMQFMYGSDKIEPGLWRGTLLSNPLVIHLAPAPTTQPNRE